MGGRTSPPPPLEGVALQVWNVNSCNGIVGVMNVQGASWDRSRRRFYIHDSSPPALTTTVRVTDVEPFHTYLASQGFQVVPMQQSSAELAPATVDSAAIAQSDAAGEGLPLLNEAGGAENGKIAKAGSLNRVAGQDHGEVEQQKGVAADWVMYVSSTGLLHRVAWNEVLPVTLQAGESTMVTVAPILSSPASSLEFSPVGFSNMLNGGGGVLAVKTLGSTLSLPSQKQAMLATGAAGVDSKQRGHSSEAGPPSEVQGGSRETDVASAFGLALAGSESAGSSARLAAVLEGEEAQGADVAVHLRGCGAFLAYSSRRPSSCRLVHIQDEEHNGDLTIDGEGKRGDGATKLWNEWEGTTSIDEDEKVGAEWLTPTVDHVSGNGVGSTASAEVDFMFTDGQFVIEVPWREGFSEQVLLLAFGRDT